MRQLSQLYAVTAFQLSKLANAHHQIDYTDPEACPQAMIIGENEQTMGFLQLNHLLGHSADYQMAASNLTRNATASEAHDPLVCLGGHDVQDFVMCGNPEVAQEQPFMAAFRVRMCQALNASQEVFGNFTAFGQQFNDTCAAREHHPGSGGISKVGAVFIGLAMLLVLVGVMYVFRDRLPSYSSVSTFQEKKPFTADMGHYGTNANDHAQDNYLQRSEPPSQGTTPML